MPQRAKAIKDAGGGLALMEASAQISKGAGQCNRNGKIANPFDLRTVFFAKHAQHVVLIHFPIALFISVVVFDFLSQALLDAAGYKLMRIIPTIAPQSVIEGVPKVRSA
jgi:hypothetical protein